ncbi:sulfite reductase [Opitutaceae bacterium TAV5]|nr:sulfite reductase [Opitutaceae bacterium TAV5]
MSVEDIKRGSRGLRCSLAEALNSTASHFGEDDFQLLKFHGSYQQDDRDQRIERRRAGLDKAWQFMVRSKIPGGALTAAQYLVHDRMADTLANGTLRLTNRQGIQMHGVLFGSLRECIRQINACGLTTWGACGDIVRNTMACATPLRDAVHREVQALAAEISRTFYARSRGYSEIWLDGEKLPLMPEETDDPVYGQAWLPRKFKIGIAVTPRNDVDVFSHGAGLVAHVVDGNIEGYSVFVGGGFGMAHGVVKTRPALAQPLFYVPKGKIIDALKAIVAAQRDHGRRDDRKQARLKYLILTRGVDWFRDEVLGRFGEAVEPAKSFRFETVEDLLGWYEQGDGRLFCGLWISDGRIQDVDTVMPAWRSAVREVLVRLGCPLRITPNANLQLCDIAPSDRDAVDSILASHRVPAPAALTRARLMSHACVALPTCGLALAESERVFQGVLDRVDEILHDLGLADEPLLIRMTGCPNGCARPYNADIAFVGRAPGKYALYVGGSHRGDRLVSLLEKSVAIEDIPSRVRALLTDFLANRKEDEPFGDYWHRTQKQGESPCSEQFHEELVARARRLQAVGRVAGEE